ncbi:MAG: N-acetylglucosamine-6-phosphate deacetylase [Ignavibacteriaceae bacterium]
MNSLVIQNGKCITTIRIIEDCVVAVEGERIIYVGHKSKYSIPSNAKVIDAGGRFISPGFIDIQINGGGGSDTLDGTPEAFKQIINYHLKHGVTNLLLTLVSSPIEKSIEVLNSIRKFKLKETLGTFILGAHIEGPYISPLQLGAHSPKYLRFADIKDYKKYFDYFDIIKIMTEAPEIPGVLDLCSELVQHGIIASIGHSNATFEETVKAIEAGFSMITHIYSVMSSVRRIGLNKVAGVLEAALLFDDLWVEMIGDGLHVPEPLFRLAVKNKCVNKIILSSDAIRAAGMKDGSYFLGDFEDGHKIIVEEGIAMTADKILYAGSTSSMDKCVSNAIRLGGLNLKDAVTMATINPARLLKLDNEIGSITKGKKANLILFNDNIDVSLVIQEGKIIHNQKVNKILN